MQVRGEETSLTLYSLKGIFPLISENNKPEQSEWSGQFLIGRHLNQGADGSKWDYSETKVGSGFVWWLLAL